MLQQIGAQHEEHGKRDVDQLLDWLYMYKGILSNVPDIVNVHKVGLVYSTHSGDVPLIVGTVEASRQRAPAERRQGVPTGRRGHQTPRGRDLVCDACRDLPSDEGMQQRLPPVARQLLRPAVGLLHEHREPAGTALRAIQEFHLSLPKSPLLHSDVLTINAMCASGDIPNLTRHSLRDFGKF